jgi:hypothetical protein
VNVSKTFFSVSAFHSRRVYAALNFTFAHLQNRIASMAGVCLLIAPPRLESESFHALLSKANAN